MDKHAYLVIIHNNFYNFEVLLKMLDDERNDIFVHVNKKVKNFDFEKYTKMCKKSNIYFTKKRKAIWWGSPLLLDAEMQLLKEATNNGHYKMYHLLSGADLPIQTQDCIHDYFDKNENKIFLQFSKTFNRDLICYRHFFVKYQNVCKKKYIQIAAAKANTVCHKIQKKLNISNMKKFETYLSKGANWFSIPDDFARACVNIYYKQFRRRWKYSILPEENFMQMALFMTHNEYRLSDDEHARYIKWIEGNRSPQTIDKEILPELEASGRMFARKFDGDKNREITDYIYSKYGNKE